MAKYDTVVINLFGGPGIGKTTTANRLVGNLKINDIDAVYISEYIKELIYKVNSERISETNRKDTRKLLDGSLYSQACIFQRQKEMLDIHVDQVPVLVTDSPLPLNIIYLKDSSEAYRADVLRCFNDEYINVNIVLERDPNAMFQTEGRIHNKYESMEKDKEIIKFLKDNNINYIRFPVNDIDAMVNYIKAAINQSKGISVVSEQMVDDSELDPNEVYIKNDPENGCIVLITIGDDAENHRFSVRYIPYEEAKRGFYRANANYEDSFDYFMDSYKPEYVVRGTDAWNDMIDSIGKGVREDKIIVADKGKDASKEIIRISGGTASQIKREER
jgi:adenylate kinase family enzyme